MITPTTELEAVNLMLSVIGASPINSVTSSGDADAELAYRILTYATREVQLVGWHWNTEENYPLVPDSNGFLVLPANTLRVDTTGADQRLDLIQRGFRLYDRVSHTFVFTSPVQVDLVIALDFDDLPAAAKHYVTVRASRQFQERVVGSEVLEAFTKSDEYQALATLKEAEAETADYSMLTHGPAKTILRRT